MSLLNEYLEKIEELRGTDRDSELFGMDEPEPSELDAFEPLPKNLGVYKTFIMQAYRINKPLRYIELVELLVTGKVGAWDTKKRSDYRGVGSINLQGYGRYGQGILARWFNKQPDGKYIPKQHLRERVLVGDFKPFSGAPIPNSSAYSRFERERDKAREQERIEKLKSRWS